MSSLSHHSPSSPRRDSVQDILKKVVARHGIETLAIATIDSGLVLLPEKLKLHSAKQQVNFTYSDPNGEDFALVDIGVGPDSDKHVQIITNQRRPEHVEVPEGIGMDQFYGIEYRRCEMPNPESQQGKQILQALILLAEAEARELRQQEGTLSNETLSLEELILETDERLDTGASVNLSFNELREAVYAELLANNEVYLLPHTQWNGNYNLHCGDNWRQALQISLPKNQDEAPTLRYLYDPRSKQTARGSIRFRLSGNYSPRTFGAMNFLIAAFQQTS